MNYYFLNQCEVSNHSRFLENSINRRSSSCTYGTSTWTSIWIEKGRPTSDSYRFSLKIEFICYWVFSLYVVYKDIVII